jgi:hypothetical protein
MTSENLIEIDNERFDDLYNLAKAMHPNVQDYFIHLICNEQCSFEAGYENQKLQMNCMKRQKMN